MSETENLCDIVIFGGHGDLAFRKLMPALYHLNNNGYLNHQSRIITVTRRDMTRLEHIALVKSKMLEFLAEEFLDESKFEAFCEQLFVVKVDLEDEESYSQLKTMLEEYPDRDRINYLSTSPDFFGSICKALNHLDLVIDSSRVVLEKPIGRDLDSSRKINDEVLRYFTESQIYRIDHYLGKDTVQNIMD